MHKDWYDDLDFNTAAEIIDREFEVEELKNESKVKPFPQVYPLDMDE